MILNRKGKVVNPTDRELIRNAGAYREVLQPTHAVSGNMFNIEQRARITGKHK